MMPVRALTRGISDRFVDALSAVLRVQPIDLALAHAQHRAYGQALAAMGLQVTELAADPALPDCVFVEDTAVIAGGVALLTHPGAPSRRAEPAAVAAALAGTLDPSAPPTGGASARGLAASLELVTMQPPATLDGGDCMVVARTIYVGRSARTNAAGIAALAAVFEPRGFTVVALALPPGVLHLKCVCSPLGDGRILLAAGSLPPSTFGGASVLVVPAAETYAANVVSVGMQVMVAAEYPETQAVLARAGYVLHPVATTEVRKADGSLTCQSLLF